MDKIEFKTFCKEYFIEKSFYENKNYYFHNGYSDVLCMISLQKSNYGNVYYINVDFKIKDSCYYNSIPNPKDYDISRRMLFLSKTQTTDEGLHYETAALEYECYSKEELKSYFDKNFEEWIKPPINEGKKFILENIGTLYLLTLNREQVFKKLIQ